MLSRYEMCSYLDYHIGKDDGVNDTRALSYFAMRANVHVRSYSCLRMDLRTGIDTYKSFDLVMGHGLREC